MDLDRRMSQPLRDWEQYADGAWHLVQEHAHATTGETRSRINNRLRDSARNWAQRRDYRYETRRRERGRLMYVRFTGEDGA